MEHLKVSGQVVPGGSGRFAKVQVVSGRKLAKDELRTDYKTDNTCWVTKMMLPLEMMLAARTTAKEMR